jgi:hypothetical protein
MVNYILITLGAIFAVTGIVLLIKRMGEGSVSKIKIPLLGEIQTANSSVIIFIVGASLIFFGASIKKDKPSEPQPATTDKIIKDTVVTIPQVENKDTATKDTGIKKDDTPTPPAEPVQPFKEFTLTAGQQQVLNDLQVTLTLQPGILRHADQIIKIRVWRQVTNPLSDTAVLDPSGEQPGVQLLAFRVNTITPVNITDVGQFKFYVSDPVQSNRRIQSVLIKMYKN